MFIITLSLILLHCTQKRCVVCNNKTLFFCIGCSFDTVGGMVHLCNPKRDKGRGCWKKIHDSRYSANPDRNMLSKKRKAQPSEQSKRKKPRKETKRSSLNPVFIWLFLRRTSLNEWNFVYHFPFSTQYIKILGKLKIWILKLKWAKLYIFHRLA